MQHQAPQRYSGCDSGRCLQAHAREDGDLTPGLLAMAQSWTEDVALPSFRGSGVAVPPLSSWFDSPQVKLHLMVRTCLPLRLILQRSGHPDARRGTCCKSQQ